MKLLILGGTVFLGRHLVTAAQARGHEITLFNRGEHNPELFPDVEKLRGNRDGNLEALWDRQWDTVIDTCGYVPRVVRVSAELLADNIEHYVFISSISVYSDVSKPGVDETAPVGQMLDPTVEVVDGETYGPLKALCEQAVEEIMPGRALNIRPGLIVGPFDPSDRFTYWPVRVARGGKMLAPGTPDYRVQIIDVRDLAEWTIRMVEAGHTGVFNAIGPAAPLTMGDILNVSERNAPKGTEVVWMDEEFLLKHDVQPWSELPLWIPTSDAQFASIHEVSIARALDAGLTFRSIGDTVRDTLAWNATRPADREWRAGLRPEREAELLQAWREKQ
jgi:nucleoside-diphosphate-sugar epimerase